MDRVIPERGRALSGGHQAWNRRIATTGRLSHNANLGTDYRGPWRKLGENVGRGGEVDEIQRAFEASPSHLRNIIDPDFDTIAVAVVEVGDTIYVTEQFRSSGLPDPNVPNRLAAGTPSKSVPIVSVRTVR